jgi:transposase
VLWTTFSHLSTLTVDEVVVDDGLMTFSARTATRRAVCPGCGTASGRVHGGYRRRLADVAVPGHRTVIDLLVRRFICPGRECARRTFVEQVDGLTDRFARRTASLHGTLEKIALALGGRPAARLAAHLAIPTSPNSLLRLLRKLHDAPFVAAPRVLGIDDFAFN